MQKLILTISITIQIPETPIPPTPASAKKPEPVLTKEQPLYSPATHLHVFCSVSVLHRCHSQKGEL